MAKLHRRVLKTPIIAITGTNGKTTTKELVNAVLSKKYQTISTQGNYNNHVGVPLTLMRLKRKTEIAVVEMGANHPGEIKLLCDIANPNYGLITNIGTAHIEGFGSFEGVKNTKKELYDYLQKDNGHVVFVNCDDFLLMKLSEGMKRYTYGFTGDCAVRIVECSPFLKVKANGIGDIQTRLVGDYNLTNVAAAIAVGRYFKVSDSDIKTAIEEYVPTNNRSQVIETGHNRIVMDAYNANPVSMKAAINNFKNICGNNPLLILGDMLELGDISDAEHAAIVALLEQLGFNNVFLVGKCMKTAAQGTSHKTFDDINQLCDHIRNNPVKGYDILVKGSHGIHLEDILNLL
jgi:UDP-N-acetylmuramoyl-tripeptide--D-alanyl-D-alanine ligase